MTPSILIIESPLGPLRLAARNDALVAMHLPGDLDPAGTAFQKLVWAQLVAIPHGETRSYGQIAKAMGRPSASRAVGAANGQNPIGIIVPCHRVIGANGSLTGYAGGMAAKQWLLEHEHVGLPLFDARASGARISRDSPTSSHSVPPSLR